MWKSYELNYKHILEMILLVRGLKGSSLLHQLKYINETRQ